MSPSVEFGKTANELNGGVTMAMYCQAESAHSAKTIPGAQHQHHHHQQHQRRRSQPVPTATRIAALVVHPELEHKPSVASVSTAVAASASASASASTSPLAGLPDLPTALPHTPALMSQSCGVADTISRMPHRNGYDHDRDDGVSMFDEPPRLVSNASSMAMASSFAVPVATHASHSLPQAISTPMPFSHVDQLPLAQPITNLPNQPENIAHLYGQEGNWRNTLMMSSQHTHIHQPMYASDAYHHQPSSHSHPLFNMQQAGNLYSATPPPLALHVNGNVTQLSYGSGAVQANVLEDPPPSHLRPALPANTLTGRPPRPPQSGETSKQTSPRKRKGTTSDDTTATSQNMSTQPAKSRRITPNSTPSSSRHASMHDGPGGGLSQLNGGMSSTSCSPRATPHHHLAMSITTDWRGLTHAHGDDEHYADRSMTSHNASPSLVGSSTVGTPIMPPASGLTTPCLTSPTDSRRMSLASGMSPYSSVPSIPTSASNLTAAQLMQLKDSLLCGNEVRSQANTTPPTHLRPTPATAPATKAMRKGHHARAESETLGRSDRLHDAAANAAAAHSAYTSSPGMVTVATPQATLAANTPATTHTFDTPHSAVLPSNHLPARSRMTGRNQAAASGMQADVGPLPTPPSAAPALRLPRSASPDAAMLMHADGHESVPAESGRSIMIHRPLAHHRIHSYDHEDGHMHMSERGMNYRQSHTQIIPFMPHQRMEESAGHGWHHRAQPSSADGSISPCSMPAQAYSSSHQAPHRASAGCHVPLPSAPNMSPSHSAPGSSPSSTQASSMLIQRSRDPASSSSIPSMHSQVRSLFAAEDLRQLSLEEMNNIKLMISLEEQRKRQAMARRKQSQTGATNQVHPS